MGDIIEAIDDEFVFGLPPEAVAKLVKKSSIAFRPIKLAVTKAAYIPWAGSLKSGSSKTTLTAFPPLAPLINEASLDVRKLER